MKRRSAPPCGHYSSGRTLLHVYQFMHTANPTTYVMLNVRSLQYNILLLHSQTDRCEGDIKYDSITNRRLPRRTESLLWEVLRLVTDILWSRS